MTMSWVAFQQGSFTRTKQGTLRFKGSLSLQNGGGFASIRTLPREMNPGGATGIVVKARGDGRTYRVQLRTDRTDNRIATSYRANLPTVKGKFNEVLIPFSDFKLQSFGTLKTNGNQRSLPSMEMFAADKPNIDDRQTSIQSVSQLRTRRQAPLSSS